MFAFESSRGARPAVTPSLINIVDYALLAMIVSNRRPSAGIFRVQHYTYRDVTDGAAPGFEQISGCSLWKVFEPKEREIESEALSILKFLLLNYSPTAHHVSGCKTLQLWL